MVTEIKPEAVHTMKTIGEVTTERAPLLTIAGAATLLGMSPRTLRAWVGARRVGVIRLGRCVRVSHSELDRLMHAGASPAAPSKPRGNK
jgi:excisionase family DNA binding protein